jgi:hypothetical protein
MEPETGKKREKRQQGEPEEKRSIKSPLSAVL